MQFVGQGDFRAAGTEFRRHFVELGGLQPHHDVLDVGSGIGRMAFGLADWLTGRYEGFDVVPDAVDWCQRRITPRHPNFRFQLADIRNSEYNPRGRVEADEYRFPYDDGSFDFAFLTSVFTHMLPPAVDNYLAELGRVVRGGGRLFATYYLVDDHSRARLDESYPNLRFDHGDYVTSEPGRPEAAVGLLENWVRRAHERHGLPIEGIFGGRWCGRERATSYQDIVISVARHLAA
jgi:SAM-dependent methyltransferase